eukprot:4498230-Alexandrium_andersonii.AAC.1
MPSRWPLRVAAGEAQPRRHNKTIVAQQTPTIPEANSPVQTRTSPARADSDITAVRQATCQ